MTFLPQHPSDEVATKAGIAALKADVGELREEIREMRRDLHSMQRLYVGTVVGSMTALTAILSVVVAMIP